MAPMTENTWDARYSGNDYLFGTTTAAFLTSQSEYLMPGKALAVADGEGRNSVYLAQRGLDVTAFDASTVAVKKARRMAEASNVTVDVRTADIQTWEWHEGAFDCVVAVFIQFAAPRERDTIFAGIKRTLRPGGTLLLHGYRPVRKCRYARPSPRLRIRSAQGPGVKVY